MADNTILSSLFAFVVLCFAGTEAGSFCYSYNNRYLYCRYGCCGNYYNEYCCSVNVGLIVGGVITGLVAVCVIIAIVCCCIKKKSYSGRVVQPSNQANGRTNVTVVTNTGPHGQAYAMQPMGAYGMQPMGAQPQYGMQPMGAQPQYGMQPMGAQPQYGMQPMGAQPPQPPMYKAAETAPPAYNYSDPAYPPGMGPGQSQPPPPGFSAGPTPGAPPQSTSHM